MNLHFQNVLYNRSNHSIDHSVLYYEFFWQQMRDRDIFGETNGDDLLYKYDNLKNNIYNHRLEDASILFDRFLFDTNRNSGQVVLREVPLK